MCCRVSGKGRRRRPRPPAARLRLEQKDEHRGDAFLGTASPHRQQRVVDHRLLVRREPCDVEAHHRAARYFPERIALENAEESVGESLNPWAAASPIFC